jgi:3-methyladenine DNA glycosylase AlkD
MLTRYGITAPKAFGISVGVIQQLAKRLGRDHALAGALWETGWYEARMLAAFIDDPARVTPAQMDRWARDFDNWGICETVCFHLFDRTGYAWRKVEPWSRRREEFVKRAASDDRNFVKKGVSWALRVVGRRNLTLNGAAIEVSRRLVESPDAPARWVGRDALKELTGPVVRRRLAARGKTVHVVKTQR